MNCSQSSIHLILPQDKEVEATLEARAICLAHMEVVNEAELIAKEILNNIKEGGGFPPTSLLIYYITNNYTEIYNWYNEVIKYYDVGDDLLKIYFWTLLRLEKNEYALEYAEKLKSEISENLTLYNRKYIHDRIRSVDCILKKILRNGKKPEIIFLPLDSYRNYYFE